MDETDDGKPERATKNVRDQQELLSDTFGFIIYRTGHKVRHILNAYIKEYAITTDQWAVLECLEKHNKMTQKEIADRTMKDAVSITRLIDSLASKGYVQRVVSTEDRRAFTIHLTSEGVRVHKKVKDLLLQMKPLVLHGIDIAELERALQILNQLYDNLNQLEADEA